MMAANFITYMAVVWLIFDKLRLIPLSLPLALPRVGSPITSC